MHKYCEIQLAIKKVHKMGIDSLTSGMAIGVLAFAMATCSAILLYIRRNPGNGNKCWKRWRNKILLLKIGKFHFTYGNKDRFPRMFAILLMQCFLVNSHICRYEQCDCKQSNTAQPPKEHGISTGFAIFHPIWISCSLLQISSQTKLSRQINFNELVDWMILTILLPETIVQITMPAVIINTEKYFENA